MCLWQVLVTYGIVLYPCLTTSKVRQRPFIESDVSSNETQEVKALILGNGTLSQRNGALRLGILPQTWRDGPVPLISKEDEPREDPLIDLGQNDNLNELVSDPSSGLGLDSSHVDVFSPNPSGQCTKSSVSRCGEQCHCINGKSYCCRQRRDWDSLSEPEKLLYLQTVRNIATGRMGQLLMREYRELLRIHENKWYTVIHNTLQFLPWHRIYLLKFENLLRKVECRLTVPYWDWTKRPAFWWRNDVFGNNHFGSNLDLFSNRFSTQPQCPSNGFFAPWTGFADIHGRCLVRQFSYNIPPASYSRIQQILRMPDFDKFESALRHEHGVPHWIVGGQQQGLFFTSRAAEDPLFFLHHSNVEYQWYQRQVRYPSTAQPYEYWGTSRKRMSLVGFREKIAQALNPFKQGMRGVCVEYVENDTRYNQFINRVKSQDEMGDLKKCKKQARRFPSSIFTLFKTSREEKDDFLKERNKAFC